MFNYNKYTTALNKISNKSFSIAAVAKSEEQSTNLNKNSHQSYSIKVILPNFKKPSFFLDKNSTLKDLAALIKKEFNFEKIEFRTWDHSSISLGNELKSCLESGNLIFVKIDSFEWQFVNYDFISKNFSEVFEERKTYIL